MELLRNDYFENIIQNELSLDSLWLRLFGKNFLSFKKSQHEAELFLFILKKELNINYSKI